MRRASPCARFRRPVASVWLALVAFLLVGSRLQATPQNQDAPEQGSGSPPAQDNNNSDTHPGAGGPPIADPVISETGAFSFSKKVLEVPGRGIDVSLTLEYLSSAAGIETNTGSRWSHDYDERLEVLYTWGNPPVPYPGPSEPAPIQPHGMSAMSLSGPGTLHPVSIDVFHFHDLRIDHYRRDPADPTNWLPADPGLSKLKSENVQTVWPHSFTLRRPDGTKVSFPHSLWEGGCGVFSVRAGTIQDRMGNTITLNYENRPRTTGSACATSDNSYFRRLSSVVDTLGRQVVFEYDTVGWLHKIRDFTNREVTVDHDAIGNVTAITTPQVTVFPPGSNATPYAARTEFEYQPVPPGQNTARHSILRVYAPTEVAAGALNPANKKPYVVNTWDVTGTRVFQQANGGTNTSGIPAGGTHNFYYQDYGPPLNCIWFNASMRLLHVDRNGYAKLYYFDENRRTRLIYTFTGSLDPSQIGGGGTGPIDSLVTVSPGGPTPLDHLNNAGPSIGSQEPPIGCTYQKFGYNDESLVTWEETQDSRTEYVYDSASSDRSQHANLLVSTQVSLTNPNDKIIRAQVYEPLFNQERAAYDPRGFGGYVAPNGASGPNAFVKQSWFDYQESPQSAVQAEITYWGINVAQPSAISALGAIGVSVQPVAFDVADLNDNQVDDLPKGNVVRTSASVHVFPNASSSTPSLVLTPLTKIQYNAYSSPSVVIDAANYQTTFSYYPISAVAPGPGDASSAADGGFLASVTSAVTSGSSETTTRRFGYDLVGRQALARSGRGFDTTVQFDEVDHAVVVTDALGKPSGALYDPNGNVAQSIVEYTKPALDPASGLPTGAWIAPRYIRTTCTYDILDNLVQKDMQLNASGATSTIRYRYDRNEARVVTLFPEWSGDHANVEASVLDEFGHIWTSTKGGLTAQFANMAATQDIPERGLIPVDVPNSTSTSKSLFRFNQEVQQVDPEGRVTHFEYDAFNRLRKSIDPIGNYVQHTVDVSGQAVLEEHYGAPGSNPSLLSRAEKQYDEFGRVYERHDSHADHTGTAIGDGTVTSRQVFDVRGNAVASVDDNLGVSTRDYDGLGRLVRQEDPVHNFTLFKYDANNNLIYTEDHELESDVPSTSHVQKTWMFHDALNQLTASADHLGHTTRRLYDSLGRVVFGSDARASQVNLALLSLDSPQHPQHADLSAGPLINGHGNTTWRDYDDTGYLLTTTAHQRDLGLGGNPLLPGVQGTITASRTYDLDGRLITEADDRGNPTTYAYDSLNRKTRTTFANATFQTYEYYKDGAMKVSVDANLTRVDYQYDAAGRLRREDVTPGANVRGEIFADYEYDGLDRLTLARDSAAVVTREYDSLSRIGAETLNSRRTVISSNGVGDITGYTYPGGRAIVLGSDAIGRLRTLRDQGASTDLERLEYRGRGAVKNAVLLNGTRTDLQYDSIQRVSEVAHARGATLLDKRTFDWDRQGNKTARHDLTQSPTRTHAYTYDSVARMVRSDRTGGPTVGQTVDYQLDDVGNRTSVQGGAQPGAYTFAPADLAVNVYTATPFDARTYDANGNLTSRSATEVMYYDYRNRLVEYFDSATGRHHFYSYDAFGRRTSKVTDQGTAQRKETRYFYDGGWRVCEEQDEFGVTLASYVYDAGLDGIVNMRRDVDGNAVLDDYFYHSDDLGNVVAVSDVAGVVQERYEYGDFGQVLDPTTLQPTSNSVVGNSRLFNGRELDRETGLYYYRNRYMEPATGRFTTRDPIGIWGDMANLGNGYTYAGNNPWSRVDPLGLKWSELTGNTGGSNSGGTNLGGNTGGSHSGGESLGGNAGGSHSGGTNLRGNTGGEGTVSGKKNKSGDKKSDAEYLAWKKQKADRRAVAQAIVDALKPQIDELNLKLRYEQPIGTRHVDVHVTFDGDIKIDEYDRSGLVSSQAFDPLFPDSLDSFFCELVDIERRSDDRFHEAFVAMVGAIVPVPGVGRLGKWLEGSGFVKWVKAGLGAGEAAAKVGAEVAEGWKLGAFKSVVKWESQMGARGWTPQQITEAVANGKQFVAENLVNKGNAATRFVHPTTGRSVIIDNITKEVIHVGGTGFKY